MATVAYKTAGGQDIRASVHPPASADAGPAVLFLHAGGLIMGNRHWILPSTLERFTGAGFTVVSADYRLAPETKLPEIAADVEDAYAWMRERGAPEFGFDPDRIAVVGASAGGYLALLAGCRFRPRPAGIVSFYGYGDLTGPWYAEPSEFYNQREKISEDEARAAIGSGPISEDPMSETSSRGDFYLFCRQRGIWPEQVAGHAPSERGWFEPFEPRRNVSAACPPTLLLHGEADTDVPFEQSRMMAEELAGHGVVHELIRHPDWGHGFDVAQDDPEVAKAMDRVVEFLCEVTALPA